MTAINSFYYTLSNRPPNKVEHEINSVTELQVNHALNLAERGLSLSLEHFTALLSPIATQFLEKMASIAQEKTIQYFGRTIQLFTPLYLSNFCINNCKYCSFSITNRIKRIQLTIEEIKKEGKAIAATGLKHLLLLTGDAPSKATTAYLKDAILCLSKYFSSIGIEVYAMGKKEYEFLENSGIDSMTLFQETYNEKRYITLHTKGTKQDFHFRLDAQSRAASAGIRFITLGALLGLDHWWRDIFYVGLHTNWLQKEYPGVEFTISVPRIRPHEGNFSDCYPVTDKNLVQAIQALRLFLPSVGIILSTREQPFLRDKLIPLSITKMSAGVSTSVGGHTHNIVKNNVAQFEIADTRSVDQMIKVIKSQGYQPIFKNWMRLHGSSVQ